MSSPKRISFLCPGRTQQSLLCVPPIPSGDCGSVAPFRLHRMAEPLSRVWNRCKWSGWEVVKSNSSKQVWIRFCFVKAPSLGGSAGKRRDRFVNDVSFQGVLNTINTERLGGEAVVRSARHDGFASFFPDGCFPVRLNGDWVSEGLVLHAATVFAIRSGQRNYSSQLRTMSRSCSIPTPEKVERRTISAVSLNCLNFFSLSSMVVESTASTLLMARMSASWT